MNETEGIRRLDAFLASRGASRATLLSSVTDVVDRPLLVVATGSILHGVGNERSDVDVNVIVERAVTRMPMVASIRDTLIDILLFGASEVAGWATAIRDQPWPPPSVAVEEWSRRKVALVNCTRFGYGFMLSAREGWESWRDEFRQPWVAMRVAEWWRIESIRLQIGARWLAKAKPLLSAHRLLESVFAELESRAALSGQFYFGSKWIFEKLRAVGDTRALAALRRVMRAPTTSQDAPDYAAQCEAVLEEFRGGWNDSSLAAQLWYLPGVSAHRVDTQTLVSRWYLRGIELPGRVPEIPTQPKPFWEGPLDAQPPAEVLALFTADMTWLAITRRTP
jgi:hypothetical protein